MFELTRRGNIHLYDTIVLFHCSFLCSYFLYLVLPGGLIFLSVYLDWELIRNRDSK